MDLFLPPKYSLNSFFVRHVAQPRRMKYISGKHYLNIFMIKKKSKYKILIKGLNNAKICSVNDVGYIRSGSAVLNNNMADFPPNNFNEALLQSESFTLKRKEKVVPPNGIWQTFGLSILKFNNFNIWLDIKFYV
jgi:hypothetical protein